MKNNMGPLTIYGNESPTEWKWISNPWPWEMGGIEDVDL